MWSLTCRIQPKLVSIQDILEYLLHPQLSWLVLHSLKVHLAITSAFYSPIQRRSVCSNPMVVKILMGLLCLYSQVQKPVPLWNLNMVLAALMGPPFEPLASCPSPLLCQKAVFLVEITFTREVWKLQVWWQGLLTHNSPKSRWLYDTSKFFV